jgi:hypothetical protein
VGAGQNHIMKMTVGPDFNVWVPADLVQFVNVHEVIKAAFGKCPVHIFFGFNIWQILAGENGSDATGFNQGSRNKIGEPFGMIFEKLKIIKLREKPIIKGQLIGIQI